MHIRWFIAILILAAAAQSALADEVFRWTDASGAVSYGEKVPAGAKGVRKLDLPEQAGVSPADSSGDPSASQRLLDAYAKARLERIERQTAEARLAAEQARAELAREALALEAERAARQSNCSSVAGLACPDDGYGYGNGYYPIVGSHEREPWRTARAPGTAALPSPAVTRPVQALKVSPTHVAAPL